MCDCICHLGQIATATPLGQTDRGTAQKNWQFVEFNHE